MIRSTDSIKNILLVVGIILTVFGFFLDHSEQSSWVVRLFAPAYNRAITAFENSLQTGSPIRSGAPGFSELSVICREKLSGAGEVAISSIMISRGDALLFKGVPIAHDYVLEVVLEDGRSAQGEIPDLRPEIRDRFLNKALFRWSLGFFCIGVAIILFENFVLDQLSITNVPEATDVDVSEDHSENNQITNQDGAELESDEISDGP
jgi:hypothetical protein